MRARDAARRRPCSAPVAWPPNWPRPKVAREPRTTRRGEAAAHREIGALARPVDRADAQHLPGRDGDRVCRCAAPARRRASSASRAPASATIGGGVEAQGRAARRSAPARPSRRRCRPAGWRGGSERSSIGPDGGTPTCQSPRRPGSSWRLDCAPGREHLDRHRATKAKSRSAVVATLPLASRSDAAMARR